MDKEKDFDVMKWLRGVRDYHYELLKDKTPEERAAFYREKAAKYTAEFEARQSMAVSTESS